MNREETKVVQAMVAEYIRRHPEMTFTKIATELGISQPHISRIAIKHGLRRADDRKRVTLNPDLLNKLAE